MNKTRVQRLLLVAADRVDNNKPINHIMKVVADEIGDPFMSEIDEFMSKSMPGTDQDSPQDEAEEKLDEETDVQQDETPETDQDSPQEESEEKLEDETEDDQDETPETDQDSPQEEAAKKLEDETVSSSLGTIAIAAKKKGLTVVSDQYVEAAEIDIVDILNDLLEAEYLQRDMYETYSYLITGMISPGIREHLEEHLEAEMEHINTLQRYVVGFDGALSTDRAKIPTIPDPSIEAILRIDLALERDAVEKYSKAVSDLDGIEEYTALKADLENILVEEQEHVHDIERWLKERDVKVQAAKDWFNK